MVSRTGRFPFYFSESYVRELLSKYKRDGEQADYRYQASDKHWFWWIVRKNAE